MKKIIVVNTSPRPKGNCAAITERLEDKLGDADLQLVDFRTATINYCHGCDACKKKETVGCVQKDDMAALLPEIDACDGLVLLTPIYWGEASAQAKTFIDRLYAFFNPPHENMTLATKFGKKAAIITTNGGGSPEDAAAMAQRYAQGAMAIAGFGDSRVMAFGGINDPGSVVDHEDYMKQVDELADWLLA